MKIPCETNERTNPCGESPFISGWGTNIPHKPYLHVKIVDLMANKTFFDQYINICTINKQPGLNIFVRYLNEQLKSSANFELACPLPKVCLYYSIDFIE